VDFDIAEIELKDAGMWDKEWEAWKNEKREIPEIIEE
jgi:hypothetical protein